MADVASLFRRNQPYARNGGQFYSTPLAPLDEMLFRTWAKENKVPFNVDAPEPQDYDMRGFWQGVQQERPQAQTAVNPNDGRLHFPDHWKTPYHQTFSNESRWAGPVAPAWNDRDQLVSPGGRILADERAPAPAGLAALFGR